MNSVTSVESPETETEAPPQEHKSESSDAVRLDIWIRDPEVVGALEAFPQGRRREEFALGALSVLDARQPKDGAVALASAGTDGIDGPTDAAGAIVDITTSGRAAQQDLHPRDALASNGAYDFFAPLGDLIMWGPTGTNVGDLHVMLVHPLLD